MSDIYRAHVSGREVISGEAPIPTNGVAQGEAPPARITTDSGVTYTGGTTGETRQERGARANVADMKADRPGILSTAKTPAGSPALSGALTPKHRITLPDGTETTLAVAEHLGYVECGPDGQYREATPKQEAQPEAPDQPQPFVDQKAERLLDETVRAVAPHTQDEIVHRVLTDKLDERTIHDTAAASGMSTEELRGRLTALNTAFTAQASAAAAEAGISDFKAWSDWARKNHPAELREAMQAHVYGRTTKAYGKLFDRYFRSTTPSTKALEAAGYKVSRDARGRELVEVDGVQMLLEAAAREGLI